MAIREGKWDCPQCGCKGNRGSEQKCGQCGKVRANEVQFYVEDDAAEVADAKQLEKAAAGADWICQFCDAINPAGGTSCRSCGAERTEKKREVKEILDAPAPPPPAPKGGLGKTLGFLLGGLALVVGAGWFVCGSSQRSMTLEKLSWERTVEVERFGPVTEEGWRDELPAGARVQSTQRKVHHTNKIQTGTRQVTKEVSEKVKVGTRTVKVGKKDLGNGYFEDVTKEEPVYEKRTRTVTEDEPVYREDPVYQDWCRYEVDKWHKARVERAAAEDAAPRWPEVRLAGQEREGKKAEAYLAVFKDDDGALHEWKAPLADWKTLSVGKRVEVEYSRASGVEGLAR